MKIDQILQSKNEKEYNYICKKIFIKFDLLYLKIP